MYAKVGQNVMASQWKMGAREWIVQIRMFGILFIKIFEDGEKRFVDWRV
jgi:hypothetical protein